jgi:hypothetical protein
LFNNRRIHKNHKPRSKELEKRYRQHWRIERKLQQNFQEMLSRGGTKLRKVEPHDQKLRNNMRVLKHGLKR